MRRKVIELSERKADVALVVVTAPCFSTHTMNQILNSLSLKQTRFPT